MILNISNIYSVTKFWCEDRPRYTDQPWHWNYRWVTWITLIVLLKCDVLLESLGSWRSSGRHPNTVADQVHPLMPMAPKAGQYTMSHCKTCPVSMAWRSTVDQTWLWPAGAWTQDPEDAWSICVWVGGVCQVASTWIPGLKAFHQNIVTRWSMSTSPVRGFNVVPDQCSTQVFMTHTGWRWTPYRDLQWPPDTRPDGISEFLYMDTCYKNVHIEKYAAELVLCCVKPSLTNLYIAFQNKQYSTDPAFK